jgi:hypothetical protein
MLPSNKLLCRLLGPSRYIANLATRYRGPASPRLFTEESLTAWPLSAWPPSARGWSHGLKTALQGRRTVHSGSGTD